MAKKDKAIYAPGELGRVRSNLGNMDDGEAKRMAKVLGGEVGRERTEDQETVRNRPKSPRTRHETVNVQVGGRSPNFNPSRSHPLRRVETDQENDGGKKKSARKRGIDPADDPSVPVRSGYWDRVRLDKFAGQPEFDIKSAGQVLQSMLAVFGEVPDYVSPTFVSKRMAEYYKRIETLVVSTRNMFPRNNAKRNARLKKTAPFAFSILDTIRYWNIERISGDLARLQARPRSAKVSDFADILKAVYKPLFILDKLNFDAHIRGAFKILYKVLYIENPMEAQNKYQDLIRSALSSYGGIRRDIHYLLYPLLMKLLSAKWLPYDQFFAERRNRLMAFLGITQTEQLDPAMVQEEGKDNPEEESSGAAEDEDAPEELTEEAEEDDSPEAEEKRAKKAARETEKRVLERGLQTLEALFPKAGWDRLSTYPDLYPYFAELLDLKRGYVLIAPTDPLQQIVVFMRILEELFFGLRYVSFGAVPGSDGNLERVDDILSKILNNWHYYIDQSFEKEYLPRLKEYVRILESSAESRTSSYAKRILNELYWTKRLYFLPFYKFESLFPPPFQKKEITPIYPEIRKLRKYLSAVASGIEQGNRQGGAEKMAPCDGIDNPWAPFVFQVPNPLSLRLTSLLAPKNRNNASLIFFTLAVTSVLDYLVNNEESWANGERSGPLFRSMDGEGVTPLTGVDTLVDAEAIFKQAMKKREIKKPAAAVPDVSSETAG
jgi:hypothetical protein